MKPASAKAPASQSRKKLIEEIATDFHAIRNKMHGKMMQGQTGGITYAQQFALFMISQCKDSGIKEISKMLCTTSSAATQLVNELVKQGFVIRKTNAEDRRALDLAISKKGQKQIIKAKKLQMEMMSKMFSSLSDSELQNFIKLNKKIINNI